MSNGNYKIDTLIPYLRYTGAQYYRGHFHQPLRWVEKSEEQQLQET
jgi:hypothetical protein